MKIMLVNTLYSPFQVGGAETSIQMLCEELVRRGYEVRVVTLSNNTMRKCSTINGVEVIYLPLRNIYWPFTSVKQNVSKRLIWHFIDNYNFLMKHSFRNEVVRFKPDVIHTNNLAGFSVAVWSVAHSLRIGIVHTSRDYYLLDPNTTLSRKGVDISKSSFSSFFWSFTKRIHSKKVECYVGISKFIMHFHLEKKFFKSANSSYIYNPVSPYINHVDEKKVKRVGFIGRITKEKGFDVFCKIVIQMRERGYIFNAISAGEYYDTYEALELRELSEVAHVEHLGRVSTKEFLDSVDIVILPFKWREPFGRVVVESALANKKVLINASGGTSELIELIPSVKTISLENIEWALRTKSENESEPDIISLFDVKKITDEYITVYDQARKVTHPNGVV